LVCVVLTFGLCFTTASLSSAATTVQRDRDQIIAELRQIQSQLTQLQTNQNTLKQILDELVAQASSQQDAVRRTLADSKLALERLESDISVLSARIDETNQRIGTMSQDVASLKQSQQPLVLGPLDVGEGEEMPEGAEESPDVPGGEAGEPPVAVAAGPNLNDIYNQARIDYTQGRYPLAISGFRDVLELDRAGELADNAHYWIGESYLAQRQHERALEEFDTVIRDYPGSNKLADAYYKKAATLEAMERRSEAMTMYELVIENFPRTPQERLARARLEQLMRTTVPR
jgi:tol-pal system protein YbgF